MSSSEPAASNDDAALAEIGRRLRDLRRRRALTLQALSEPSGVSTGMLSQIERGISTPSIRTLQRVAEALEVPLSWFFSDGRSSPDSPSWVLRRSDRRILSLGTDGVTKELLAPAGSGAIELLHVTIEPGGSSGPLPYTHNGEDAGLVLEGMLRLEVDGTSSVLSAGDAFRFKSTLPHRFENAGTGRAVIVWAVSPPFY